MDILATKSKKMLQKKWDREIPPCPLGGREYNICDMG
jgi:hypothetical protein